MELKSLSNTHCRGLQEVCVETVVADMQLLGNETGVLVGSAKIAETAPKLRPGLAQRVANKNIGMVARLFIFHAGAVPNVRRKLA